MATFRTARKSVALIPLFLASVFAPSIHAITADETGVADFAFASSSQLFYAGPKWLAESLPGAKRSHARFVLDRAGDVVTATGRYDDYVGTLAEAFDVNLFNNMTGSMWAMPKLSSVTLATANTPYYYAGAGTANWGTDGTWGPSPILVGTGYPNGAGDSALNFQVVNGHVIQNVSGGVTVGIIDNLPTTAGNSAQAVSWTITTTNPIILDSGSAAPAQINNSQAVGDSSLTLNTTNLNGLQLASNVTITNANPNGLITISAPISDHPTTGTHSVTVVGPGTTILAGSNTYQGGTTVSSGTLLVDNSSGSGTGSGAVQVNNGGTLGGGGTIAGGDVTLDNGGILTAGTNGAVGSLTLTVLNLNFNSGSIFQVDILGAAADLITLSGALNITSGATINFNASGLTQSSYTLATYDTWNSVQFLAPTVPTGYELVYGPDALNLVAVPEPSTWAAAALAFGAIGFMQRRRFRRSLSGRA